MLPSEKILQETQERMIESTAQREKSKKAIAEHRRVQADVPEQQERRKRRIAKAIVLQEGLAEESTREGLELAVGITDDTLERVIGSNEILGVSFLELGVLAARTVGRIDIPGLGMGTGFMVAPNLILTNNHVIPTKDIARSGRVRFNFEDDLDGNARSPVDFNLDPDSLFITDIPLDYSLVAVRKQSRTVANGATISLDQFGFNRLSDDQGKVQNGEKINIIQHPEGKSKSIALQDNDLVARLENFLHYETDTNPGSSGAPLFNNQWEIIGLHHSGVPRLDDQGRKLTRDGTLWLPAMGDNAIDWIANEGVRISKVMADADVKSRAETFSAEEKALVASFLNQVPPGVLGGPTRPAGAELIPVKTEDTAVLVAKPESKPEPKQTPSTPAPAPPTPPVLPISPVTQIEHAVSVSVPLVITIRLGGVQETAPAFVAATEGKKPLSESVSDQNLERLTQPLIDSDYTNRTGYAPNYLGVEVPLPIVQDTSTVSRMDDERYLIPYEHFSVVINKKRRLAWFTASNVDGRVGERRPEVGKDYSRDALGGMSPNDQEKWKTDPRIPALHQLPDVFYNRDRQAFDKGHIVRREDVCWGASYAQIQRANGDTFHSTNCSPQVKDFNRSTDGGIWGKLENYILKQATDNNSVGYNLIAGPVLEASDPWFEGFDDRGPVRIQIPKRYWKMVVTAVGGRLKVFAFVLEQDLARVRFQESLEANFAVDEVWKHKMIAVNGLEAMLSGLQFPDVLKTADQYTQPAGRELASVADIPRV